MHEGMEKARANILNEQQIMLNMQRGMSTPLGPANPTGMSSSTAWQPSVRASKSPVLVLAEVAKAHR